MTGSDFLDFEVVFFENVEENFSFAANYIYNFFHLFARPGFLG